MKNKRFHLIAAGTICFIAFSLMGCGDKTPITAEFREKQMRDKACVLCCADAFDNLNYEEKILLYFLSKAAVNGDPIIYKQIHPQAYRVKLILDGVIAHSEGIKTRLIQGTEEYAALFWCSHGFYNRRTGEKIIPLIDRMGLQEATVVALSNGAEVGFRMHKVIQPIFDELEPMIFDPEFEPASDDSNLQASVYPQKYSPNSPPVKTEEGWTEKVCRAGNDTLPPGLYAEELTRLTDNLRLSMEYSNSENISLIKLLAQYFETGEPSFLEEYTERWVNRDSKVDWLLGFYPAGSDPKNKKGSYRGIVFIRDEAENEFIRRLMEKAPLFLAGAPWTDELTYDELHQLSVCAGQLATASGDAGYLTPSVVTISAPQSGNRKTVIFTNVREARSELKLKRNLLLAGTEGEKSLARSYCSQAERLFVCVKETLGRMVCKTTSSDPDKSDNIHPALEECFAASIALWCIGSPEMMDFGFVSGTDEVRACYQWYLRNALLNEVVQDEIRFAVCEPECLTSRIILRYLMNSGCVFRTLLNGRTFFILNDTNEMHLALSEITSELARIQADRDSAAFADLVEDYGTPFDSALSEEINRRIQSAGLPMSIAVVTPVFELSTTKMGKIKDVSMIYPQTVIEYGEWIAENSRVLSGEMGL